MLRQNEFVVVFYTLEGCRGVADFRCILYCSNTITIKSVRTMSYIMLFTGLLTFGSVVDYEK